MQNVLKSKWKGGQARQENGGRDAVLVSCGILKKIGVKPTLLTDLVKHRGQAYTFQKLIGMGLLR